MFVQEYINGRYPGFLALCKSHHVSSIYAFGSATGKSFDPEKSDIDLIVDIDEKDPLKKGDDLLQLWDELELFFHRKVDVLTPSSIKNSILKENIERSKVLLYAR
jgi:hypothetical protein